MSPTARELEELADKCSFGKTRPIGIVKELDREDILKIYQAAL